MSHPAFEQVRSHHIASLKIDYQEYRHKKTKARHIHLAADDEHNVFLVAFLTVPQDSKGVAHILEHTALCGSRRYPVRDPFFMMARRSLKTFMNAFTSSDWTGYPFASQNRKDYYNLLDVYLDAVFFPLLNELDFAQEGHRVEFADADDPESDLVYKGVVFNEMKGAMDSPIHRLSQDLQTALFPTLTYHYNSGGEPEQIPELSHAELKAFHAEHYHPSNAWFMTYGDIPAEDLQARFEADALSQFEYQALDFSVPDERRFDSPRQVTTHYALDGNESTRNKTHIVVGWLWGKNTDPRALMEGRLLADVLLDNSSSPLRYALETSKLGAAPSAICGFDDSSRETLFAAGLEGSNPEHAEAIEALILDVISSVAGQGVPQEVLESVLHQLELSQREITGDGSPYGLTLMMEAMTPAVHGGDPVAALDLDGLLEALHNDIKDPEFIKNLARCLLLDNQHRVRLVMQADTELSRRQADTEAQRLALLKQHLSAIDKERIVEQTCALRERQQQDENLDILPCVTLADVPADRKIAEGRSAMAANMPATWYAQGTNGMVYQQLVLELPALDEDALDLLPLYCVCMSEVGANGYDYLATQARQAAVTGGVAAYPLVRGSVDDTDKVQGIAVLAGRALARNQAALTELLAEIFTSARFDELPRLRELIAQMRAQREENITGRGHLLALNAACAGLSPTTALAHRWDGLAGVKKLQALDNSLDDAENLAQFGARLQQLGDRLKSAPRQLLIVSEEEQQAAIAQALDKFWMQLPAPQTEPLFSLQPVHRQVRQGWITSTQVSFCAKVYPTVAPSHADAPVLLVLGELLRNGYLHRAVREQGGAYGVSSGYHPDSGAFRFFSYRDPRFEETFADFDRSVEWMLQSRHTALDLEEAILGIISAIDKPGSPAGEAIGAFYLNLFGRTPAQRRAYRQQVLDVSLSDLERVARDYLVAERASVAALGDAATLEPLAMQQGWEILTV